MEAVESMLQGLVGRLRGLAQGGAILGTPVSVGERHVVPLCELTLAVGGGYGTGEGQDPKDPSAAGKGTGMGSGGMAKAQPVAVIVVEGDRVRLESLVNG